MPSRTPSSRPTPRCPASATGRRSGRGCSGSWPTRVATGDGRRTRRAGPRASARRSPARATPSPPRPKSEVLAAETRRPLLAALARLRDEDREVIGARYLLDLSEAETAETLGLRPRDGQVADVARPRAAAPGARGPGRRVAAMAERPLHAAARAELESTLARPRTARSPGRRAGRSRRRHPTWPPWSVRGSRRRRWPTDGMPPRPAPLARLGPAAGSPGVGPRADRLDRARGIGRSGRPRPAGPAADPRRAPGNGTTDARRRRSSRARRRRPASDRRWGSGIRWVRTTRTAGRRAPASRSCSRPTRSPDRRTAPTSTRRAAARSRSCGRPAPGSRRRSSLGSASS